MINAKELMIGDYVDVSGHGNPIELGIVKGIYDYGNELSIGIDNVSGIFAGNEILPIELTKEFFLQNGFTELYADKHIVGLYNRDNYLMVDMFLLRCCFKCRISKIGFKYVHEFQHYLRLIGLSEMANNLKL